MWRTRVSQGLAAAASLALLLLLPAPAGAQAVVVDGAERSVTLPGAVTRVFPAGPPASVMVAMVAPDMLLGWTRALRPPEAAYFPEALRALPELGRLTGRGNTVNLESVLKLEPSLVLDIGSVAPTYASLADRVQAQTGIPTILLEGRLAGSAATFRTLGTILGRRERAETLAAAAEAMLALVETRLSDLPRERRARVFLARGPRGLETAVAGSINAEALELAGARNVADAETLGARGIANVGLEQVIAWAPDAIVTIDARFAGAVGRDPAWQALDAVRAGRVHLSPDLPFTWIDSPPSANRLIGVVWLAKTLYPERFADLDLRAETQRFYALFYGRAPEAGQLDALLGPAAR